MATRRSFLQYAGAGLAAQPAMGATKGKQVTDNIYAELGVRTLINGRGVATFYSGTLMPPEVHRAMQRASEHYVEIVELQKAVGARLAHYAGTEAAMVCSEASGTGALRSAERIFKEIGISMTEAIRLFLKQVKLHKGVPFPVSIPN